MYRNNPFDICVAGPVMRKNCHIDTMDVASRNYLVLMDDVCDFICEIKKECGDEYPHGTLYDFTTMFNLHLECLGHQEKLLLSEKFMKVCNTLDNLMAD